MAIPTAYAMTRPILEFVRDGRNYSVSDIEVHIVERFELTEDEKNERIPSGPQRLHKRIEWAIWVVKDASLLESPSRGFYRISEKGSDILVNGPGKFSSSFLKQCKEIPESGRLDLRPLGEAVGDVESVNENLEDTPEEIIKEAYDQIRAALVSEILETVKGCSPRFFERLVVDLLVKMGYGGSREEAGQAVGRSGDGGIDGVINEDRLGLDVIYIQAKRWENTVGSPEVQQFAGALQGKKANKGIIITTSSFSSQARSFAESVVTKIIMIPGTQLAEFMIDYDVGVTTEVTYEIKRIDTSYFEED